MKRGMLIYFIASLLLIILSAHVSLGSVPDSDRDGVPDLDDKCPNSQTNVVDQFGCGCEQKNCTADNNPCTDNCGVDSVGRVACNTYNSAPCSGGNCVHGKCIPLVQAQNPVTSTTNLTPNRTQVPLCGNDIIEE